METGVVKGLGMTCVCFSCWWGVVGVKEVGLRFRIQGLAEASEAQHLASMKKNRSRSWVLDITADTGRPA